MYVPIPQDGSPPNKPVATCRKWFRPSEVVQKDTVSPRMFVLPFHVSIRLGERDPILLEENVYEEENGRMSQQFVTVPRLHSTTYNLRDKVSQPVKLWTLQDLSDDDDSAEDSDYKPPDVSSEDGELTAGFVTDGDAIDSDTTIPPPKRKKAITGKTSKQAPGNGKKSQDPSHGTSARKTTKGHPDASREL